MSLLERGNHDVIVFQEEVFTDQWGNTRVRASATGVLYRATVQPLTSTEDQAVGDSTTSKYRLRLASTQAPLLGAAAQVEWQGKRYSIDADPRQYTGSRRTAHVDYVMVRA